MSGRYGGVILTENNHVLGSLYCQGVVYANFLVEDHAILGLGATQVLQQRHKIHGMYVWS